MKPIGPQTEAGPAVVRARPATKAELQRWLRVAEEDLASAQAASEVSRMHAVELRRDIAKAEAERDHMQAMLTDAQADLDEARGRIAQLEEALAKAHEDLANVSADSPFLVEREADGRWLADCGRVPGAMAYGATAAEARAAAATIVVCRCEALEEERAEAQQRHAVEMGEMRSALLHLCRQLEREIRRGGGA